MRTGKQGFQEISATSISLHHKATSLLALKICTIQFSFFTSYQTHMSQNQVDIWDQKKIFENPTVNRKTYKPHQLVCIPINKGNLSMVQNIVPLYRSHCSSSRTDTDALIS